jgi:ketosteroid isomerase-like protein
MEDEIWATLHRHLKSIFERDAETYVATTSEELSLFEWWVTPHRQDGLDFHRFMIEHMRSSAGSGDYRYDLLEPRLQLYGDTAIVSYTFMLSRAKPEGGVEHRTHNESRVLIKHDGAWQIVHVHKSPAWQAPFEPK